MGESLEILWAANGYYEKTTSDHVYRGVQEELQTLDSNDQHVIFYFGYTFDKRRLYIR